MPIYWLFFPLGLLAALVGWISRKKFLLLKKSLRETQSRLDSLVQDVRRLRELGSLVDTAVGIVTFDAEDYAFAGNSIFCHLRQLSQEAMLGSKLAEIVGFTSPEIFKTIKDHFAAREIWKGEISCQREDKSQYWCYSVFYPQFSLNGSYDGCMVLVIDMTEIKQTQVMLDRTRHLTALGEMAGSIAHEINNPLAVIAIRTEVMVKKVNAGSMDQAQLITGLNKILTTTLRISKIIDAMRKLSRIESGSMEPQIEGINNVVQEALEFVDERARRNEVAIEVKKISLNESDSVLTLGYGLQQVLINLLGNALDVLEPLSTSGKWIRVICTSKASERLFELRVIDSGPEIPKEVADHLMTPFFTTKSVGKGTGLGLSLSGKIAESHGGRLYLDRKAVHTTFVLEVPMSDAAPSEQQSA